VTGDGGLQRWDALDSLTDLVSKSMVAEEEGPDQTSRYRLLETMRAYARQQLATTGEADRLARRHAEHYTAFAELAGPELLSPRQLDWQHRIRAELDNLQAAVTWAMADGDQPYQLAFRIVAALAFSAISTRVTVGAWAERILPQIGTCPPELRATVFGAAAWSAFLMSSLATRASSRTCSPSRATAEAGIRGAEAAGTSWTSPRRACGRTCTGPPQVASRRPGAWLMLLCVINSEDTARRPTLFLPNRIVSDRRDSNPPVRHRSAGYRAGSPRKPGDGLRPFRRFRVTPGADGWYRAYEQILGSQA